MTPGLQASTFKFFPSKQIKIRIHQNLIDFKKKNVVTTITTVNTDINTDGCDDGAKILIRWCHLTAATLKLFFLSFVPLRFYSIGRNDRKSVLFFSVRAQTILLTFHTGWKNSQIQI